MLRLRTPLSALAVAGLSLAIGACGGGSSGQSAGPQPAGFQKLQACLKDNGVTLPSGRGGFRGKRPANPKLQQAMRACAKYRPRGARPGNGNGNGRPRFDIKAFTPYLTCLQDHGLAVKVSDGFNALRGLAQSDPKVQAAFKACQSKIPKRPNRGTSTAATT